MIVYEAVHNLTEQIISESLTHTIMFSCQLSALRNFARNTLPNVPDPNNLRSILKCYNMFLTNQSVLAFFPYECHMQNVKMF